MRMVMAGGRAWVLPALCAVHCMAAPLLALVGVGGGLPPGVERVAVAVGLVVGWLALRGGWRVHGRIAPVLVAAAGTVVWVWGEAMGSGVAGPGGFALAGALVWNVRLRAQVCVCPACEVLR